MTVGARNSPRRCHRLSKHANFIVNQARASAVEVIGLMHDVRDHVAQRSGIELEFEVKRWVRT